MYSGPAKGDAGPGFDIQVGTEYLYRRFLTKDEINARNNV